MKPRLKLHLNGGMTIISGISAELVKQCFRSRGITISSWAREHGYTPQKVIRVLNGFDKWNYGQAHEIAIKLGLKNRTSYVHPSDARTPEPQEGQSVRAADGVGTIHGGATA
ncbi:DNA-binding protein [Limnohabitans sp.]|uniref:DNA-binding protein n=1 Tax=Limnohabitans sp. TaxID=1907725 RepID=UPI00286F89F9|nr:DNA-binding protein [Limnohabitans sp.]